MLVNPMAYGSGGGTHYSSMPYTSELEGLFEVDSLDVANGVWRNKITGGNDLTLVGGSLNDNALKFVSGEYGHVDSSYPFTYYLVVKKPVLDNNKVLCGSANSSRDRPSIELWNNGDGQGTHFFEFVCSSESGVVYGDGDLQNYHVVSCSIIDSLSRYARTAWESAFIHYIVDNQYVGSEKCVADLSSDSAYRNFNGAIGLNCRAFGNAGNIDYLNYGCTEDSYYRAFAFGGKQTFEQMQANHKYLYERYCT